MELAFLSILILKCSGKHVIGLTVCVCVCVSVCLCLLKVKIFIPTLSLYHGNRLNKNYFIKIHFSQVLHDLILGNFFFFVCV